NVAEPNLQTHPTARPGRYVKIDVSYMGPSLNLDVERQLVEPFSAKPMDSEASLDLATLYRNVTQCGGFTDVRSAPGEGTTFGIFLPMPSERTTPKLAFRDLPQLPGGTETLLLVEHEPLVSDAIGRVLKGLGYRVLRANDGIEALKIVARRYLEI